MKQNTFSWPIAICACLLVGCASDPIEISGEASAPAFRTFKVQEERFAFSEQVSDSERARIAGEMRSAAVSALTGHGYREVGGTEKPDVLVVIGAVGRTTLSSSVEADMSKHINPVNTAVFDGSTDSVPTAAASETPPGIGREGDLVLYLLDPETQRSLWRASSTGAASTPGEAVRKARSVYKAMVRKLPPGSA